MWDLSGPGLEPVSPALAGGFLTTAPPGKPQQLDFSCMPKVRVYYQLKAVSKLIQPHPFAWNKCSFLSFEFLKHSKEGEKSEERK